MQEFTKNSCRQFMQLSAMATAGLAVAACAPSVAPAPSLKRRHPRPRSRRPSRRAREIQRSADVVRTGASRQFAAGR